MRSTLFLVILLLGGFSALAQDTIQTNRGVITDGELIEVEKPRKFYDPKVAARRSAIIPGWGQIYNDSWWKVPIVYGGLGVSVYYVFHNNSEFRKYEDLINEELAKDPADIDPNTLRVYRSNADYWRKNRDLMILVSAGLYALQILEASIDAHLKGFDVDEKLSLNLKPKIGVINNGAAYLGVGITLPIGR